MRNRTLPGLFIILIWACFGHSVLAETDGPALTSATGVSLRSLFAIDGVRVEFSEPLLPATANDRRNYLLSGPDGEVGITRAQLDEDARFVVLTATTPLTRGATYILRVSNVRDASADANEVAADTSIAFLVGFTLRVIGSVTASNSVTDVPGGVHVDVRAAGRDIGGNGDDFAFYSQGLTGDFDVMVRLDSLGLNDGYSEAGLMARNGESTNGQFAAVLASGGLGGVRFQSRTSAGQNATSAGALPVNYPHTWLRLQRVGTVFTGFGGFDGQTWMRLGSATIPMPLTINVGFAVSSHNPAATVDAAFRDFGSSGGTVVSNLELPFEPLGPSSRRTGLVISEIMYHPLEVGFSLEFIEIFNGQDYYEDLSGFQIDGDVHYTFPPGTLLQSGEFLVVARDPAAVEAHYGINGVLGPWRMDTNVVGGVTNVTPENLPNSSGTVRLENELGAHLLEVNYDSEGDWPASADGAGHSLVLARPSYGENDVRAWAASEWVGGSPGRREGYVADPQRAVVINEFLAHTDDPQVDFIELFNTSLQAVDISGCWLSDDFGVYTFEIPGGTIVPPRSSVAFDQNELGFNLSSDGEEILFANPEASRVLDVVRFGAQANGVSRGRFPNGSPGFVELSAPTPGTNNAAPLRRDIVINELMYHPISGDDDDEYVELHNRGSNGVNVSGWRFVDGISFTMPLNTVIGPDGYLVVAKDRTNLLARHPGLNSSAVLGDYGGQLANGGERVALAMPDYSFTTNGPFVTTNVMYVVVDEVTYGDGGRWGSQADGTSWTDGGGSSLELIDPEADNRLAANWADSDETTKATWTTIERTALIDLGMGGNGTPSRCEFFIEGPGECLVDEVEVLSNGGTNRVMNPGFEASTGWTFQGTHAKTSVQTGGALAGARCLRLRAVERGDPGPNKVWTAIATMPTGAGNQATLRARVRWLRGNPNFLMRVRGQWLECAGQMSLPTNLGTPGAANSRMVANAGPAIYDVKHTPALPAANEPVIVTARVDDPDGVSALTLRYRVDPAATLFDVSLLDDGVGADAIAGDGIYSGTLPGRPANTLVAFRLRAQDSVGAENQFPNDAPTRECLVRFGETLRPGSIATYRLWLTEANIGYWNARERNSNEGLDATFVYGNSRVVYNAQTLYSGSPWHTRNGPYNGPLNNTCDYEVNFPPDDRLLGASDFVLNGQNPTYSGTFHQDVSAQAETTAYWFGRKLGLGINHKRHVFVVMNGQFRGMIYFDHQQPNREIIDEYFPSDPNGRLHKIEDWFEFDDAGDAFDIITCTLQNFVVGGEKRSERYRWTWRPRAGTAPNDFADLFALVDAANITNNTEAYTAATLGLVDMRNWMRVFALQQMIGNWDSYGYERGKNMYAYKPTEGPWKLVLWDLDLVVGKDSHQFNNALFDMNNSEPVIMRMYQHPPFVREYWQAMHELVTKWMDPVVYSPLVDARYAAFRANEVPVDSPDGGVTVGGLAGMRGWIAARRGFIQGQIPTADFSVTGTNFIQTANNYITLNGTAPINATKVLVNGGSYPLTWTTVTGWSLRVPVSAGTNTLVITVVDGSGNLISNDVVTVNYTGVEPDPKGSVYINEIMFNPRVDQTSFIELFNAQSSFAFDLSGWRINGLSYTFPAGAVITPRTHLVVTRNRGEFAKLYGATRSVFDQFDGALDNDGETLTLFRPGAEPGQEILLDKVKYEGRAPWPALASGQGSSLQLIDPAQDHARVSNWSDGKGWRFFSLTGVPAATRLLIYLTPAGNVYLDEISLVPGSVPGVGSNYLANGNFESPLGPAWQFQGANGTSTAIRPEARLAGNSGLDLRFTAAGGATQNLYQDSPKLASNTTHTLSFWYLPSTNGANLEIRMSAAFRATINVRAPPDSQVAATPGTNNAIFIPQPAYPLVWLNEVLPLNTSNITDNVGDPEPWIELFNSSDAPISLNGFFLSDDYANLAKWAFPASAAIPPGQFKVVFADGEPGESTQSDWHTSFRVAPGGGSITLSRLANGVPQIVDYLNFDNLLANWSYGAFPDGQLFDREQFFHPTPGASNNAAAPPVIVYINEWMAGNSGFILDPADDDADDWFELYNPNPYPVDLGRAYLTDNLTNIAQFYQIPNNGHYVIAPFGYLLVWADGEPQQNSTNHADLHVDFQLRQAGEEIGLFASDRSLIDSVTFGRQTNDVSQGRYPAGTGPIYFMTAPSPRWPNLDPTPSTPPEILSISTVGDTQVSFVVSTISGRSYQAEYKENLGMPTWTPLGSVRTATGPTLTVEDTILLNGQRFYRVVLLP